MLSPKLKRSLYQVIPFGVICLVFSFVFTLLERGIMGTSTQYPSTGNPYHFDILVPSTLATIAGLLVGTLEVLYLKRWFQKGSFLVKILSKIVIYLLLMILIVLLIAMISNSITFGLAPWDEEIVNNTIKFFSNFAFWSIEIYLAIILGVCLFYSEVSDNIGQGVLLSYFTGKYHQPREEERIFMFLDMKSSTTIAEKLGHVQYFNLLKEYYADLSDPIIQYGGEIYQYVGDEVVITWRYRPGKPNLNCLFCFFAMKRALKKQSEKYQHLYGVVPTFKAGVHLGRVTTGEIGVIKKDISFSGDVLNTTARIQGLCNAYQVDILVSRYLIDTLGVGENMNTRALGETELRGRNEKIDLFTVEP